MSKAEILQELFDLIGLVEDYVPTRHEDKFIDKILKIREAVEEIVWEG